MILCKIWAQIVILFICVVAASKILDFKFQTMKRFLQTSGIPLYVAISVCAKTEMLQKIWNFQLPNKKSPTGYFVLKRNG